MRVTLGVFGVALALGMLTACGDEGRTARETELRAMLEALTPANAEPSEVDIGGCDLTLPQPDCADVYLVWPRVAFAESITTMERLASSSGWNKVASRALEAATMTYYDRDGFTLLMSVPNTETRERCATYSEAAMKRSRLCRGDFLQIKRTE